MKSLREPYRCRLNEFWHRQIGHISPKDYADRVGGCQDLIERLQLYGKLDEHTGCVNTVHFNPSGEILVSGSDDCRIIFWDWAAKSSSLSYFSGHDSNVFQAKVMPFSDDRSVVSCAADGQVRHAQIGEDGRVETKKLAEHQGCAHKLAIEPGSPRLFYSCGEDGVVRHVMEMNKSTPEDGTPFALIPDVMMHLLRVQRLHARRRGRSSNSGTFGGGADDDGGMRNEDSESESSFDDGSQECIIS